MYSRSSLRIYHLVVGTQPSDLHRIPAFAADEERLVGELDVLGAVGSELQRLASRVICEQGRRAALDHPMVVPRLDQFFIENETLCI